MLLIKKRLEGPIYYLRDCSDLTSNKSVCRLKNELEKKRAREHNENHDEENRICHRGYKGKPRVKKGRREDPDNIDNKKHFDNVVHERNNSGNTPLFMTLSKDQVSVTKFLVENGADLIPCRFDILSNEEISKKLQEYNLPVVPVNDSTRSVLISRLKKFQPSVASATQSKENPRKSPAPSTTRSPGQSRKRPPELELQARLPIDYTDSYIERLFRELRWEKPKISAKNRDILIKKIKHAKARSKSASGKHCSFDSLSTKEIFKKLQEHNLPVVPVNCGTRNVLVSRLKKHQPSLASATQRKEDPRKSPSRSTAHSPGRSRKRPQTHELLQRYPLTTLMLILR
ncbi:hypothetical protein QYM36_008086 [Artemia franciscana]|uniref:LEM domain-containing protein n=1 Tax=Artemia franciscana TaxID=6661 RepID=A0AA88IG21_ARTSF|nr:hypothetical protein QYM36_008086 [Artemia franciscana]